MRLALACLLSLFMISAASAQMSVAFEWGPTKKCFDSKSPPFSLSAVPEGTATLSFHMTDLNAMSFMHGGGKVAYTGQKSLPYGAFRYKGPCPPQPHTYAFTVKALDAKGKTLAAAKARRKFP